jgi:hypothetical protein
MVTRLSRRCGRREHRLHPVLGDHLDLGRGPADVPQPGRTRPAFGQRSLVGVAGFQARLLWKWSVLHFS